MWFFQHSLSNRLKNLDNVSEIRFGTMELSTPTYRVMIAVLVYPASFISYIHEEVSTVVRHRFLSTLLMVKKYCRLTRGGIHLGEGVDEQNTIYLVSDMVRTCIYLTVIERHDCHSILCVRGIETLTHTSKYRVPNQERRRSRATNDCCQNS